MTGITCYNFNGADVRTIVLSNGEPGFVGKDVAERLGYEDATTAIRSHCRGVQILHPIPDALGRMQQTRILTERGQAFGKNVSSPENLRETQPHWFSRKGEELLRVMGVLD